jgi:integrase
VSGSAARKPRVDPAVAIAELEHLTATKKTVAADVARRRRGPRTPSASWATIAEAAPVMAATMADYLDQLSVSARPATVVAAESTLRLFAGHLTAIDPHCQSVARIERRHVEDYKLALAARPGRSNGSTLSARTIGHQLGMLRTFFERLIEWDCPDTPSRPLIFNGDIPRPDEPLPRALDDPTAAKFMAALNEDPNRRRRLMVELLARTGMRVGELCALRDDAMIRVGDTWWLRVPVGKLHNDRHVPLHPVLVELIDDWLIHRPPSRSGRLVERDDGNPFERRTVHRYVVAVARRAGVGHVHPHQLRHTLATQAINRGMSLEAIAALLGHRSMRMTLTYARINDDTVAEQYFNVTGAIEDRYRDAPAHITTDDTVEHRRLLGNGHCARPVALDCSFETICERCGFFETGPAFTAILQQQRHDAATRGDHAKATILDGIIQTATEHRA